MGRKTPEQIVHYRRRTWDVLCGGPRANEADPARDWLGNRRDTGASKINVMLIDGATLEQMSGARGAVSEHLRCLRHDLGLPVECQGGVYRFDRRQLAKLVTGLEDAATASLPLPAAPALMLSGPPAAAPPVTAGATAPVGLSERLKSMKYVVEIAIGLVTLVGLVIGLVWGRK